MVRTPHPPATWRHPWATGLAAICLSMTCIQNKITVSYYGYSSLLNDYIWRLWIVNYNTMSFPNHVINDELNIGDSCYIHMHGPFNGITMGHIVWSGHAGPGPEPSPALWWQMIPSVIWVQLSPQSHALFTYAVTDRTPAPVPGSWHGCVTSSSQLLPWCWISVTAATVARERQKQLPGTTVSAMTIWSGVNRRLRLIGNPREH